MARKVQTFVIDDLDGSEAESTVHFGLDGTEYEIDLNAAHAEELRNIFAPYTEAARKVTGATSWPARSGRRPSANSLSTRDLRAWAMANGIEVKSRGRVPAGVIAKFQAWTSYGDA
jgi:hypothetical protein